MKNPFTNGLFFSSHSLLQNKIQTHIEFYGVLCFQFSHFIHSLNDPFFSQLDLQKCLVSFTTIILCLGQFFVFFI